MATLQPDFGGAVYSEGGSLSIANCTFSANQADAQGGALAVGSGTAQVINSILWGNKRGADPSEIDDPNGVVLVTYSDIQGGHTGDGNLDSDPQFVDSAGGNFSLKSTSPCIDHGTPSGTGLVGKDLGGKTRVIDGKGNGSAVVDMGAFEYVPPSLAANFGPLGL
jgi:predicted outer membrane repeat protein